MTPLFSGRHGLVLVHYWDYIINNLFLLQDQIKNNCSAAVVKTYSKTFADNTVMIMLCWMLVMIQVHHLSVIFFHSIWTWSIAVFAWFIWFLYSLISFRQIKMNLCIYVGLELLKLQGVHCSMSRNALEKTILSAVQKRFCTPKGNDGLEMILLWVLTQHVQLQLNCKTILVG